MRAHDPRTHGARAHDPGPGRPEQYAAPDAGARGGCWDRWAGPKQPSSLKGLGKLSPRPEDEAPLLEALVFVLSNTSSFKIRLVESYTRSYLKCCHIVDLDSSALAAEPSL